MKNLLSIINEHNQVIKNAQSVGTPDGIMHKFSQGYILLSHKDNNAYPFIYNIKNKKTVWGESGLTHNDLLRKMSDNEKKEFGINGIDNVRMLRYCTGIFSGEDRDIDKWYEDNKEWVENIIIGRAWIDVQDYVYDWMDTERAFQARRNKPFDDYKKITAYICSWTEIPSNDFTDVNNNIMDSFEQLTGEDIKLYVAVDNNGKPIVMDLDSHKKIKVQARTDNYKKDIEQEYEIHTGTSVEARKLKRDKTEQYRKDRDKENQKIYNHTKSKTEAEWRSLRYQENMKSIENIINEKSPDLMHYNSESYLYSYKHAFAFIYNSKIDDTLFSKAKQTHSDMIDALKCETLRKSTLLNTDNIKKFMMCFYMNYDDLRPIDRDKKKTNYILGRLWYLHKDENFKTPTILISFWQELDTNEMHKTIMSVINKFVELNDENINIEDLNILADDNNGKLFSFEINNIKKIDNRTEENKKLISVAHAIHLASQKEKDDFYAKFKENRDKEKQKIYNHTKSKTEAEWRSLRYQESMKSIEDIINEGDSSADRLYIKNGDTLRWGDKNAYPFFYNSETKYSKISRSQGSHFNLAFDVTDNEWEKLAGNKYDEIKSLYSSLKLDTIIKSSNDFIRGRVWVMPTKRLMSYISDEHINTDKRNDGDLVITPNATTNHPDTIFIAVWDNIADKYVKEMCKSIIEKINKQNFNNSLQPYEYYFIDANGDWEIITLKDDKEISTANVKSEEEKNRRKLIQAIHLASQKEKQDFYAKFKENRDKEKQKIYNHTKSKTEAEWRSLRYQESMKHINDIINEKATPDNVNSDLSFINGNGETTNYHFYLKHWDRDAKAFLLNIKNNKTALGKTADDTHWDLIYYDIDNACDKMGLQNDEWTVRPERGENIDNFYKKNPHMKNIRCGRLWHFPFDDKDTVIIGWWEELNTDNWYTYTIKVLEYYNNKNKENKIDLKNALVVGIDNNCNLFVADVKNEVVKKKELSKRTKSSQDFYKMAKAIHLANQKEKQDFYAKFKENRDKENQKIYNHTKSRTEAEWRSLRYQESMKNVKTCINEAAGKMKIVSGIKPDEVNNFKMYDVCVYDSLMKHWMSSITTDDCSDAFKSYEEALTNCNNEIEEGYWKGLQILGSNDGNNWKVLSTWGRQKFHNNRR